ncbi:hypothetical protein [Gluconobacter oxydans]|nr:hypothetical protein [Gluconobacter oxydans]
MITHTDADRRAWLEKNYALMPEMVGPICPQTAEVIDRMMREEERE